MEKTVRSGNLGFWNLQRSKEMVKSRKAYSPTRLACGVLTVTKGYRLDAAERAVPPSPRDRFPQRSCYQDPDTKILVPRSRYQDLGTKILVPRCWYQDLVTRILVPRSWYQDPGTKILVPRSWYQDLGTKNLAPRSWHQDPGTKIFGGTSPGWWGNHPLDLP